MNYVAVTLEGEASKGRKGSEDANQEALAALITERAQVASEKASGEATDCEKTPLAEKDTEKEMETFDKAPTSPMQITEHKEPLDEVQQLFHKISAERGQGRKATVRNAKIIFQPSLKQYRMIEMKPIESVLPPGVKPLS